VLPYSMLNEGRSLKTEKTKDPLSTFPEGGNEDSATLAIGCAVS